MSSVRRPLRKDARRTHFAREPLSGDFLVLFFWQVQSFDRCHPECNK
jgi:hypothetical protein